MAFTEERGNPQGQPEVEPVQVPQEEQGTPDPFADLFTEDNMFGTPDPESAPEQNVEPSGTTEESERQAKLDERTFQYWQSQAAKRQNEIDRLKAQIEQPSQVPMPAQATPPRNPANGQFVPAEPEATPQDESFREPPKQPERPRNFSRVEANSDDMSESARYLDDLETYRTEMVKYNVDRATFNETQRAKRWSKQQEELRKQQAEQTQRVAQQRQLQQIAQTLKDGYQATDDQVSDFMRQMSSNSAVTVDNLWRLYAFNNGIPVQSQQVQQNFETQQRNIPQPSPTFNQQSIAQQVPSPMGVLPSDGTQNQKSDVDSIVDEMLRMENNENPF